jgi:hypothetical protein
MITNNINFEGRSSKMVSESERERTVREDVCTSYFTARSRHLVVGEEEKKINLLNQEEGLVQGDSRYLLMII